MQAPPNVQVHVPELEFARDRLEAPIRRWFRTVDLFERKPHRVTSWGILDIRARFLFRDRRTERMEVPASATLGRTPPVPEFYLDRPQAHSWVQSMEGEVHACTACSFSPGFQTCVACMGTGLVSQDGRNNISMSCFACAQTGHVACSLCGGEKACVWAKVSFARDATEHFRRLYFPFAGHWSGAATQLRRELEKRKAPDALRVPIEGRKGPYRGGPTGETEFHGFRLSRTLERARSDLKLREQRRPLASEVQAFAWPVLELVYSVWGKGVRAFILNDLEGLPQVFVDD